MIQRQKIAGYELVSFSNNSRKEKRLLKKFVDFHWQLYKDEKNFVPLLDYEYLGFKLIGITGFFEPKNLFFKHAKMRFFLLFKDGKTCGRCNAFVNHRFNEHWQEKIGFFGQFEVLNDQKIAQILLEAAEKFLNKLGMEKIRGPQNLPMNDATPGFLTAGFDTRPVMYYHYNKKYYPELIEALAFQPVKKVFSWEVSPARPMEAKLDRLVDKIIKRYQLKIEEWDERPLAVRKKEMREIYNAAWSDNFNFVPFTEEEFDQIIDDMQLIMDKKLFIFLYIKDEPVAFFGGVPNVSENLKRIGKCRHLELIRALKMLGGAKHTKGFRLGYLGVKPKFRRLGLDGVMIKLQKIYTRTKYDYCDIGWVLEDNKKVIKLVDMLNARKSKTYTVYQKKLI